MVWVGFLGLWAPVPARGPQAEKKERRRKGRQRGRQKQQRERARRFKEGSAEASATDGRCIYISCIYI